MTSAARSHESGVTLTEVAVVFVLAAVVLSGMIAFYLNSQATWIDGSAQAITQREATLVLRELTNRAHAAAAADATPSPNASLTLFSHATANQPRWYVWCAPEDSLLYETYYDSLGVAHPMGPMLTSRVETFVARVEAGMVYVDTLRLLTPQGTRVTVSGSSAMVNRGAP